MRRKLLKLFFMVAVGGVLVVAHFPPTIVMAWGLLTGYYIRKWHVQHQRYRNMRSRQKKMAAQ